MSKDRKLRNIAIKDKRVYTRCSDSRSTCGGMTEYEYVIRFEKKVLQMEKYYLGFDAGTQSVKVAVYDEKMQCVVSTSAPTTLYYPHPGWVEMNVDEYLELTIRGMKKCADAMREKGLDPSGIRAIMGDGIICGIAGVDADGNAITPYINYLDSRTQEDEYLINSWDLEIWGKETGNP